MGKNAEEKWEVGNPRWGALTHGKGREVSPGSGKSSQKKNGGGKSKNQGTQLSEKKGGREWTGGRQGITCLNHKGYMFRNSMAHRLNIKEAL